MGSLIVTAIVVKRETPLALLTGFELIIVGMVVSAPAPVVKLPPKLAAIGTPARSVTPVETETVCSVLGAN
jgi:hypothetical protein